MKKSNTLKAVASLLVSFFVYYAIATLVILPAGALAASVMWLLGYGFTYIFLWATLGGGLLLLPFVGITLSDKKRLL